MDNRIGYRPTWAEVNLGNLAHNFQQVKRILAPRVKVMVTVKADAYGHGLIPVAKRLVSCGIDFFGVASIDEGIQLRRAQIKNPILILGIMLKEDITPVFKYKLTPTVCTLDLACALDKMAAKNRTLLKVHIKVDTGMGRIGVLPLNAETLVKKIHKLKHLEIEGVFTHFAFADMNRDFTLHQIELFQRLIAKLETERIRPRFVHCANSMGVIGYDCGHFNMVRPGLVIYGIYPKKDERLKLRPVLSLKTRIVYHKRIPRGHGISYGHTYVTKKETTVATLPIGYGDGYPRNLSNIGPVLIKGERFKISGRVCMDQMMVDVADTPVKVGQEAVLIGRQGKNKITAEELADLSGTIPYEIVCGLGNRVPRIYVD